MPLPECLTSGDHTLFWFRRDLRLTDNHGLTEALNSADNVIALFIFDENILEELRPDDRRVKVIHQLLEDINKQLLARGSRLVVIKGRPLEIYQQVNIHQLFFNRDYEPYARQRDQDISKILESKGTKVFSFKDHVIFEKDEIITGAGTPYTVYTPYAKNWLRSIKEEDLIEYKPNLDHLKSMDAQSIPSMDQLGFTWKEKVEFPLTLDPEIRDHYGKNRDYPSLKTSRLGVALRFGAISTRQLVRGLQKSPTLLGELIWRDFFQSIIHHFPNSAFQNFRKKYDGINWRYEEEVLEKWKKGQTGYPMVDAGMRELNETGFMHNRVRMVTASFLVKHLLHHWSHGEAYFAEKLLDYEMASNVGNWQWAAGTGCDAAPYFRVFNPESQMKKFDPDLVYVKKWVPELESSTYPDPIVDHKSARLRAIETYKAGLSN